MDDKGSITNVDGPSVLKKESHVPRRELHRGTDIVHRRTDIVERKIEIVLFAENARMELKGGAKES
jgi:hypothetical protein